MRFLIQVVNQASVDIDGERVSSIGKGMLVLVGIGKEDDEAVADKMIAKLLKMRIFSDSNGKTNLSLADVEGEMLLVSQFTLYADCRHGNRPSFTNSMGPQRAEELYNYVADSIRPQVKKLGLGVFGADMKVSLINNGPFTVILDSEDI
ncbi:MAG: D-aminoacyl-tRNA deacylase [Saccharofermentans sp.]|nr:D-aminoacyl-tRNA deacylase [Saccharofermentans sp.]